MLSEISMVEEEFMSHESTTMKGFLSNAKDSDRKSIAKQLSPYNSKMENTPSRKLEEMKEAPNPLQRLLEKKKTSNGKGKLVL